MASFRRSCDADDGWADDNKLPGPLTSPDLLFVQTNAVELAISDEGVLTPSELGDRPLRAHAFIVAPRCDRDDFATKPGA